MEAPGYWDDPEKSQEGMKELKNLKDEAEDYHALEQQYEDIETLIEMGNEEMTRIWCRRSRRSWRPLQPSWIP